MSTLNGFTILYIWSSFLFGLGITGDADMPLMVATVFASTTLLYLGVSVIALKSKKYFKNDNDLSEEEQAIKRRNQMIKFVLAFVLSLVPFVLETFLVFYAVPARIIIGVNAHTPFYCMVFGLAIHYPVALTVYVTNYLIFIRRNEQEETTFNAPELVLETQNDTVPVSMTEPVVPTIPDCHCITVCNDFPVGVTPVLGKVVGSEYSVSEHSSSLVESLL